ncbi:MAG: FAD-binding protein [Pirellulales bacterium]|nr:FAD-binding protein [Pirellulales bacterium]
MTFPPLIQELRRALGGENVISAPSELAVYDCDAFTARRRRPEAVVFPRSGRDVAETVRIALRHGVSIVPRGAGTSLAGGCLPGECSLLMMLSRMNRILEINLRDRTAVVEPGVLNLQLTTALGREKAGCHFAPDPSSQGASTIGGNVATNAGGPHTLKYGVTVNHVLGVEAVLGDGRIVQFGPVEDPAAFDLSGLMIGSEGTLGIVTKVWVRLTPDPQDHRAFRAIFDSLEDASNTVTQIIAAGIVPAALELMDQGILGAVEAAFAFGFPADAGAVLVIEIDGLTVGLDPQEEQIVALCKKNHAREVLQASTERERELLWKCRKSAVGATGRLSPSYILEDGVVPRTQLPRILGRIAEIGRKHQIRIVNVAHAGDGNVHPILLYDERDPEEFQRAMAAGREVLDECLACGGSITAEHGVGVQKLEFMPRQFTPADLAALRHVKTAFDPAGVLNPGKLIPS